MYCLKCGRETTAEQIFCDSCLTDMEKYPVKPGTAIHIPSRPAQEPQKKPTRKRQQKPEELLEHAHKLNRRLLLVIAVLALLLCITGGKLLLELTSQEDDRPTGRNYTTGIAD